MVFKESSKKLDKRNIDQMHTESRAKKEMGRGILFYLMDGTISVFCGYAIHIGIGRYLGPAQYGIFGVIISLSTMSYIFFNYGVQISISKHIAEYKASSYSILKAGRKIQFIFGAVFTFLWIAFASVIAGLLHDQSLVPLIRLMALAILPSAIYTVYLGFLNGTKAFARDAITGVFYSIIKVAGVFLFVLLGFQVKGALGGYIIAPLCGVLIAKGFSKYQRTQTQFAYKKLLAFATPIILFTITSSLLMNIDLLFVKSILRANDLAGFYASASNIAKTLWFSFGGAFCATLVPLISHSTSNHNTALTKKHISQSLRYMVMILLPIAFIISGTAYSLIQFLYSNRFYQGGGILSILVFGFAFFCIFAALSMIITAGGKPRISMIFVLIAILIDIALNLILIPNYRLIGAALATTISSLIGLILCAIYIYKKYRVLVNPISLLKISIASLAIYFITTNYTVSGFKILIFYVILFSVYFLLLLGLREINREDITVLKSLFIRAEK